MAGRRSIHNFLAIIGSLMVAILLLCLVAVHTEAFRNFLKSEIIKQAMDRTGARVEIGSLKVNWTRVDIDLAQVVAYGSPEAASNEPALLQADRLEVAVRFHSLLSKQIELRTLVLERPVLRLRIDSQGRSNLPTPPAKSANNGVGTLFDLEIGDCSIRSGEIHYNDQEIPVNADFHGLDLAAAYNVVTASYKGSVAYESGLVTSPGIEPIRHALQLQFTANRSQFALHPLILTSGASSVTVNANLTNYSDPRMEGTYEGTVSTGNLADVLRTTSVPLGTVALSGKIEFVPSDGRTLLARVHAIGEARSERLDFRGSQRRVAATRVSAAYELANANLTVKDASADVLGGHARGNLELKQIDAREMRANLALSASGVSVPALSEVFAPQSIQKISFTGSSDLDLRASWSGSMRNLEGHGRATISSPPGTVSPQGAIPVNGLLQINYSAPQNLIDFEQSYIQTAGTKVTVSGALSARRRGQSAITLTATTKNLGDVASLAELIQDALEPSQPALKLPHLGGTATMNARVTGTAANPHIQGQLAAQNLVVDRTQWLSLGMNVDATPSEIAIQNGALIGSRHDQFTFSGRAALQDWKLTGPSPIALQASISNLSLQAAEALIERHDPVSGTVSGKVSLTGTRQSPEVAASLTLVNGSAWNEPIQNLALRAQSQGGTIHSTLEVRVAAGTAVVEASYTTANGRYSVSLHSTGVNLEKIARLQQRDPVRGIASLSLNGAGAIRNPQFDANLNIPTLQVQDQTISNVAAQIQVANQHAAFQLHSNAAEGVLDAKGDVALAGSHYATATLDVRALPVAAIAANFKSTENLKLTGQTEVHATLSGPLDTPAQIQAQIEIPTLNVISGKAQMALAHPLQAQYRNGILNIVPTQIQGTGTTIRFGGTISIAGGSAYSLSADGSMDLNVLQQFAPGFQSSGEMEIHLRGKGQSSKPDIEGEFQVKNAVLSSESLPVALEGMNADIHLSGERAEIVRLSGNAGGGALSARGYFDFGREKNSNLLVDAKSVRIRYPTGLRSVWTGQLNFQSAPGGSALTGRIVADSVSFTPQFDLMNFVNFFSRDTATSASSPFENNVALRVAVASQQSLNLASRQLSIGGALNLNVGGTLAQPVVLGRINVSSGDIFFLGKQFQVQSGTIEFANPVMTEPVINAYVTTTVQQYNLTLKLTGPINRLTTDYTSDPALPPADIIHLLAFGTTTAQAASADSQSTSSLAESVLAQGVGSQVAGRLESFTGISQLTIDPLSVNTPGNPADQIAIQQRVTGSLLFTFSTNVTTTQGQTAELQYTLSKPLSVVVLRDQNGGYAVDLRLHKVF